MTVSKSKPMDEQRTVNVLVVGAGPAGLLASILLLRRNLAPSSSSSSSTRYKVTLVDPGTDYGKLDAEGLNAARSWMIGLSSHGLAAIRSVPSLYEDYIRGLGIDIVKVRIGVSKRIKFEVDAKDILPEDSSFTVDRNCICAALGRYLNDNFEGKGEDFDSRYHTRALYVDGERKRVVLRPTNEGAPNDMIDVGVDYDVLLGCDGIRSVVRNAFVNAHRDFEFNLSGTFGYGKSVHVPLPADVDEGTFMFLNDALPGWGSFVLPETGRQLNVALGTTLNRECPPELASDDAKVVAEYFREHWHAFDMDVDEAGRQWVGQGWNRIGQVHCNFYHSERLSALLLGDAAHATSPQIGQGMNTALADAVALNSLLDEHGDDWEAVLPKFSEERVKEGNALTDLSFYTFSLDASQQLFLMMSVAKRRALSRLLPWFFEPNPMDEAAKGMKLSEAYHRMCKLGIISRVRTVNDGIMRDYFEKKTGMVRKDDTSTSRVKQIAKYVLPAVAAFGIAAYRSKSH